MFCAKCGKSIDDSAEACPACGAPVVHKRKKSGCMVGCLVAVLVLAVAAVALVVVVGGGAASEEAAAVAAIQSESVENATKNGEDLIAWIRTKSKVTDLVRDDSFARLKTKTVILRGTVRQVGKAMITDEIYVSLTVGQLNALERINVQFNLRESLANKVAQWQVGEIHSLKGRVIGQGDLEDDASCDLAEIVE